MKKLLYTIGCLCLTLSVISCSADDFIENINANEIQNGEVIVLPPTPLENGDNNGDETKEKKD